MRSVSESPAHRTPAQGPGPRHAVPIVEWLLTEGWTITESAKLVERLALRLGEGGIPLTRILLFVVSLHPQVVGVRITWQQTTGQAAVWSAPYHVLQTAAYRESPVAAIMDGTVSYVRRRLDVAAPSLDYSILRDLLSDGATDYVAVPVRFSDGAVNAITFATDQAGGFTDAQLDALNKTVAVLARLLEIHSAHHTAATLLHTYLGQHTGEQVRRGHVRLGEGEDIHAVIWFCDLRGSTVMADSMPRASFLQILNDFFDCVAGAVLDQGGEVLRFIGDAALAIFPIGAPGRCDGRRCCDKETACHAALTAAKEAQARMAKLNQTRAQRGEPPLGFGLALHMGDVTYGNIGVAERLEFTVIGAAANEAARLEGLCKTLNRSVLISGEFKRCFPGELVSLGRHTLRGVRTPQEVFTLPETADSRLSSINSIHADTTQR